MYMARQLKQNEELAAFQDIGATASEYSAHPELESWLCRIEQQRDAVLRLSPELEAWFGEQFTDRACL